MEGMDMEPQVSERELEWIVPQGDTEQTVRVTVGCQLLPPLWYGQGWSAECWIRGAVGEDGEPVELDYATERKILNAVGESAANEWN